MKGYKRIVFIANLILVLVVFNWLIIQKEYTITNGTLVLLKLYPVDPRSLMQGDYMTLRYEMTRDWRRSDLPSRGYCIVKKNEQHIAAYQRLQSHKNELKADEIAIKYYSDGSIVKIGAESFFFEEGQGRTYNRAKYGGLRVESSGSAVLVGLYDEDGKLIKNQYTKE